MREVRSKGWGRLVMGGLHIGRHRIYSAGMAPSRGLWRMDSLVGGNVRTTLGALQPDQFLLCGDPECRRIMNVRGIT